MCLIALDRLQVRLYEDFSKLKKDSIQNVVEEEEEIEEEKKTGDENNKTKMSKKREKVSHIFQVSLICLSYHQFLFFTHYFCINLFF